MKKLKDYTTSELENLIADVIDRKVGPLESLMVSIVNWWNGVEKKLQEEIDYPCKRRKWFLREVKKLRAEIDEFLKKELK